MGYTMTVSKDLELYIQSLLKLSLCTPLCSLNFSQTEWTPEYGPRRTETGPTGRPRGHQKLDQSLLQGPWTTHRRPNSLMARCLSGPAWT